MLEDQDLITLEVNVKHIIYYDEDTYFCVMKAGLIKNQTDADDNLIVVGSMPPFQAGDDVRATGKWSMHPKYGTQFTVEQIQRIMPATLEGIRRFLGSGLIDSIGQKTADKIVDHYGLDTIDILDSPDAEKRLLEVDSIGDKRAKKILESWIQERNVADIMMFLQQYGITSALALKIHKYYTDQKQSAVHILQTDPYQLSRDIHGIGFKRADAIAQQLGLPHDSPSRMQAALMYALDETVSKGHVYFPAQQLINYAAELLEDAARFMEPLAQALHTLVTEGYIVQDRIPYPGTPIDNTQPEFMQVTYGPFLHYCETEAASYLSRLMDVRSGSKLRGFQTLSPSEWQSQLQTVTTHHNLTLTTLQEKAIHMAVTSKLSILTGGPGTGKTTTLRTLINLLDNHMASYALASPTGRAAKRLSQATGRKATTIHRLLGGSPLGFSRDNHNLLEEDVIIIDEASMIDIKLFFSLIRAVNPNSHVVLVGDVDQLPSVGPGDVLRDLIKSRCFPVTRLNAIFRQARGSSIIQNAHRINEGQQPILDNQSNDFFFFNEQDPEEAAELVVDIVHRRLPEKFGYNPLTDVQVLAPMYRTPIGVTALNTALQDRLNPPHRSAEAKIGNRIFRAGDKVMQTRNNYERGVFNGDTGYILKIDPKEKLFMIEFENQLQEYKFIDMDDITLAYACTVHRAQGSEYPVIVMPIMSQHYIMLQRNLLYTAITRAKEMVVLVGMRKAVGIAVRNNKVQQRYTALAHRIWHEFNAKTMTPRLL